MRYQVRGRYHMSHFCQKVWNEHQDSDGYLPTLQDALYYSNRVKDTAWRQLWIEDETGAVVFGERPDCTPYSPVEVQELANIAADEMGLEQSNNNPMGRIRVFLYGLLTSFMKRKHSRSDLLKQADQIVELFQRWRDKLYELDNRYIPQETGGK